MIIIDKDVMYMTNRRKLQVGMADLAIDDQNYLLIALFMRYNLPRYQCRVTYLRALYPYMTSASMFRVSYVYCRATLILHYFRSILPVVQGIGLLLENSQSL